MITKEEIQELLHSTETYRVERTTSTGDMDKFQEAICAFANDLPNSRKKGYLILGAYDNGCNVFGKDVGKNVGKVGGKLRHTFCNTIPMFITTRIKRNRNLLIGISAWYRYKRICSVFQAPSIGNQIDNIIIMPSHSSAIFTIYVNKFRSMRSGLDGFSMPEGHRRTCGHLFPYVGTSHFKKIWV